MSKDIKKALEHCIEWNCVDCPNREELGSGETVCRGRLLTDVLEYVADLEAKLAESENKVKGFVELFDKKQHENYEQFCEIMQLKQQLKDTEESYNNTMRYLNKTRSELLNLPKKIVEEIRKTLNGNDIEIENNIWLTDILDTISKKYGGEHESLCCNVKQ